MKPFNMKKCIVNFIRVIFCFWSVFRCIRFLEISWCLSKIPGNSLQKTGLLLLWKLFQPSFCSVCSDTVRLSIPLRRESVGWTVKRWLIRSECLNEREVYFISMILYVMCWTWNVLLFFQQESNPRLGDLRVACFPVL